MKKWNEWTKKQKAAVATVLAVCVIGGGVGSKVYADNQYQKEVELALKSINKRDGSIKELLLTIEAFRDSENVSFLAKDLDMKKLASALLQVEHIESHTSELEFTETKNQVVKLVDSATVVKELASVTEYQAGVQTEVNALFQSKDKQAINGHEVDSGLAVADGLTLEIINKVESSINDLDMYELIPVSSKEKEKSWQEVIQELIDNAKKQVETITATTKTIESFFKDGKPVDTTDSKKIEEVEAQLNTIKNETTKKQLVEKLKSVKESVAKKAEAKKKEEEASKVAAEQATTNAQAPSTGNGSVDVTPDYGQGSVDTGAPSYDNSGSNYTPSGGGNYGGGGSTGGASTGSGGGNTGGNWGGGSQPSTPSNNGGGGPASQEDLDNQVKNGQDDDWSGFF